MAEMLRKEPDTQVEVVDGGKGEFTVTVDGNTFSDVNVSLTPLSLEHSRLPL